MSVENSVVAIYRTHADADRAVKELQHGGVDMHKLSIVGKGYHTDEQVIGYYNTGDRMKYWGKVGAFWGGFWGLLFGSAPFHDSGSRPNFGGWTSGGMDRSRTGGCRRGGSVGCFGSWSLQHRHPQGQHCEVPNGAHHRSVSADRPWNSCRSCQGQGHYRKHKPCTLHTAYRGTCGRVVPRAARDVVVRLTRQEPWLQD
jgi:hypothetical protein